MSELAEVLRALSQSTRLRHWHRPPREFGPDNPEDSDYNRNGLKDVGDLTKVGSLGFSFSSHYDTTDGGEGTTQGEGEGEAEGWPQQSWPSAKIDPEKTEESVQWLEKTQGEGDKGNALTVARQARNHYCLTLLLDQLALENKCQKIVQERSRAWQESYLNRLNEIRSKSEEEWREYLTKREEDLAEEESQLRQQTQETKQAIEECQTQYSQHIALCSSQLVAACERVQQREAEEATLRRRHLDKLNHLYSSFLTQMTQMHQLIKELGEDELIEPKTESFINQTASVVEDILNCENQNVASDDIAKAQAFLEQSFVSVKEITLSFNEKKEEKLKLEEQKAQAAALAEEQEREAATSTPDPTPAPSTDTTTTTTTPTPSTATTATPTSDGTDKVRELREQVKSYLEAKDHLKSSQVLKLRQLAKPANQLNVTDQFINRDRLQQVLATLGGSGVGAVELLFLKNLVAWNVVKLGTSQNFPTAAVYAWMMASLSAAHPDLWPVFLHHLYTECPGLVPVVPPRPTPLTSVDPLHRALGRRDNEGEDGFSRRTGTAAYMYGMVVSMMARQPNPPDRAAVRGWQLLATTLASPPVPCVTAEVLLNFLKGCGAMLLRTYSSQFRKMMVYISRVYLPLIDQVKGEAGKQSYVMLHTFIKEYEAKGNIPEDPLLDKFS